MSAFTLVQGQALCDAGKFKILSGQSTCPSLAKHGDVFMLLVFTSALFACYECFIHAVISVIVEFIQKLELTIVRAFRFHP